MICKELFPDLNCVAEHLIEQKASAILVSLDRTATDENYKGKKTKQKQNKKIENPEPAITPSQQEVEQLALFE
jgi:hypothetical protein